MRIILLSTMIGCTGGGQTPIEVVTVSALRQACVNSAPQMCLTMQPDFEQPETLFFGIDGYTHRWGVESELIIRREPIDPITADGQSELITISEVLAERQPIVAPFDLVFSFPGTSGWFTTVGPERLNMLGTTVRCEAMLCNLITSRSSNFVAFGVTMELTEDDQTLQAVAVQ